MDPISSSPVSDDQQETASSVKAMHAGLLSSRGYVPDPYDAISLIFKPSRRSLSAGTTRGYTRSTLEAVHNGDVATLESLLRGGLDPNSQNKFGTTLLHRACSHSQARVVRLLLDSGAQVRCADDGGKTPLHDLCWMGSVYPEGGCSIAHMLLSVDESLLRAHDRLGFTPLDYLRDAQVPLWAAFLDENKELFWSPRNAPGRSPEEWAALLWPMPVADCGVVPPHRPPEGSSTAATAAAPMVRYAAARESEAPEKAEAARTGCHHPGNSGACASPDCGGSVSAAAAAAAAAAGAGTALHASAAPPVIEVAPPVGGGGWRGGWCVPK